MDTLNVTFLALSDPTRRVILERLRRGSATVNELAEPFGVSQQAISKHLAYLERASLIEKRKEGREQFCSLRAAPLQQAYEWMDEYRQFWEGAFDRLDALLQRLQQPQRQQRKRNVRRNR
ncbi:MAG TPA: metalloregulator ArsR/SmtB family transcription factor [Steroidobacteraceae bacterium]|nr:metalloregulator ArsR/SmtB family transcription factor [Steroidobacteraceae bacterium]